MGGRVVPPMVTRIGTIEYLDMCDRALERQRARLAEATVPDASVSDASGGMELGRQLIPDVWLTLVALNASSRALNLAGAVSTTHGDEVRRLSRELSTNGEIKRARDVYEHLDAYLRGEGNLQKTKGDRADMHLPEVGISSGAEGISGVMVRVGGDSWVQVLSAIDSTRDVLRPVIALLDSEP